MIALRRGSTIPAQIPTTIALMARAILLLMLLYGWQACAAVTTPARLTDGPDSIESQLLLPKDLPPSRYVVHCEGSIRKNGRVDIFLCYTNDKPNRPLVNAVVRAAHRAKFVPATRDGKNAAVYMVVMVRIDITDQGALVLAVPNNGVDAQRYGLFYSAPQRFNEFTWNSGGLTSRAPGILVWQKIRVDEHGKVLEYEVTNPSGVAQFFITRIEHQIERMDFMPGYFEGKPVPMLYVEPVLD